MKITQLSASRLSVQVEETGQWVGSLIASMILWGFGIQQFIVKDLWQRWGTFGLWDWGILCMLFAAIVATFRLFTDKYVRTCTFDLDQQQIEMQMYQLLNKESSVKIPLHLLEDVLIHKESGDSNDYYYIALKLARPYKPKLVLPERTEDQKLILEQIAKVRHFLSMPPL